LIKNFLHSVRVRTISLLDEGCCRRGLQIIRSIWSLRFYVFVAGAAVMALEIVGSRLLAPLYGDSVYVWGSLIGVVMAALALGYYLGGRLADRGPRLQVFLEIILAAGVFTMLIPMTAPAVFEVVFYSGLGDRYGPLLASILILSIPTTLLGMVSPYAIRLAVKTLINVGEVSGGIYSISTAGSIFGTFFTVFFLVPEFGVRQIVFSVGLLLIGVSLIGVSNSLRVFALILTAILIIPSPIFLVGTLSIYSGKIVYQKDTAYHSLSVVDDESRGVRTLWLNSMPHSAMYLNGSNASVFRYTDYFHIAFIFNPEIRSVLFIGGGGFSGPKKFLEDYPEVKVDVVEVDPEVVETAKRYFNVKDDPRLRIFVEDGRAFLSRADGKYDLIVLDAYSKTYVPFHLMTIEFFRLVDSHLNPDGVVVMNLVSSLIGDTSDLLRAEYKTISQVLPQIYAFTTRSRLMYQIQNIILVATKNRERFTEADLKDMARYAPKRGDTLSRYVETLFQHDVATEDVPVLTDDYAPAQRLLNPVTGTPYVGGEGLFLRSAVSPFVVAGLWASILISLYFIFTRVRLKSKDVDTQPTS